MQGEPGLRILDLVHHRARKPCDKAGVTQAELHCSLGDQEYRLRQGFRTLRFHVVILRLVDGS